MCGQPPPPPHILTFTHAHKHTQTDHYKLLEGTSHSFIRGESLWWCQLVPSLLSYWKLMEAATAGGRVGGGGGGHTHTQINAGTESWERGGWARQAAGQALFCGVFMASPSSGISDTWKGSRCCFSSFIVSFFCCFFSPMLNVVFSGTSALGSPLPPVLPFSLTHLFSPPLLIFSWRN